MNSKVSAYGLLLTIICRDSVIGVGNIIISLDTRISKQEQKRSVFKLGAIYSRQVDWLKRWSIVSPFNSKYVGFEVAPITSDTARPQEALNLEIASARGLILLADVSSKVGMRFTRLFFLCSQVQWPMFEPRWRNLLKEFGTTNPGILEPQTLQVHVYESLDLMRKPTKPFGNIIPAWPQDMEVPLDNRGPLYRWGDRSSFMPYGFISSEQEGGESTSENTDETSGSSRTGRRSDKLYDWAAIEIYEKHRPVEEVYTKWLAKYRLECIAYGKPIHRSPRRIFNAAMKRRNPTS